MPDIADGIRLNEVVTEINYAADKVVLKTADNSLYEADKLLITTPIKILQSGKINFQPALPKVKSEAIEKVFMGDGIKIFIEFKEKFYPDIMAFGNVFKALNEEEKFVYDAAFKKESTQHILGLFAINDKARANTKLDSEMEIVQKFLGELDELFDGKASRNYLKHVIQNWSNEPFIQGSYSYSFDGNQKSIVKAIAEPVSNKLYFAGEALSIENQATVHGACQSAYSAVASMLEEANNLR